MVTLDSLDLGKIMCCGGIKLNSRGDRSVDKRVYKRFEQGERTENDGLKMGVGGGLKKSNFLSRYSKLF